MFYILFPWRFVDMFLYSQNKLQNLAGQHSDVLENLTPKVRRRVEVLREIQVRQNSILILCLCHHYLFKLLFKGLV